MLGLDKKTKDLFDTDSKNLRNSGNNLVWFPEITNPANQEFCSPGQTGTCSPISDSISLFPHTAPFQKPLMRGSPGPPGAMRSSLPNFANINNIHQCEIHMKPRKRQNFLQVDIWIRAWMLFILWASYARDGIHFLHNWCPDYPIYRKECFIIYQNLIYFRPGSISSPHGQRRLTYCRGSFSPQFLHFSILLTGHSI